MKIRKSLIGSFCQGLLLAGIATLPLATAQAQPGRVQSEPADTEKSDAIRTAITTGDLGKAGKLFNQMVDTFLAEGAAQPDPALDQLLAEILIAAGLPREARPLLDRALAASPAGAEVSTLHLKRAQVREDLADFAAAESDYRLAIASYASGAPEHRQAVFGLARVLLADKPGESSRLVTQELANAMPDNIWEGQLILARAAAILGHPDRAREALQHAWAAAPSAPVLARAVPRIANDMALQAGLARDRETLVALSIISRADRPLLGLTMNAIHAGLPICGSHGLLPTDRVVVELVGGLATGPGRARLAYASRPGIAAPFLRSLIDNPAFWNGRIGGPVAAVEMRCLTALQPDYAVLADLPTVVGEWLIANGAYPVAFESPADWESVLIRNLSRREARFGPESLLLVPVLLQQFSISARQSLGRTGPTLRPLLDIAERVDRILDRSDAPADIKLMSRLAVLRARMLAEDAPMTTGLDEYRRLLSDAASNPAMSLDMIYAMATLPQAPVEIRADLARRALVAFEHRAPADDRRRQTLTLRVAISAAERGDTGATSPLRKAGLPTDLCELTSPKIDLVHQEISSEDFPLDMRRAYIQGTTMLDLDVSTSGETQNARVVLAEPPLLFNTVAIDEARLFRYDPPKLNGKPALCRGYSQFIRWRLPE